jgi:tetratricopeptide (TPR) repeat protein
VKPSSTPQNEAAERHEVPSHDTGLHSARMPGSILQSVSGSAAYRADSRREVAPRPGAQDGVWIAVTSLLEHASLGSGDSDALVRRAIEIAIETLGDDFVRSRGDREWPGERTPSDAILLLSDRAYEADALNTVVAMLAALDRAETRLTPVQRGRLLARRAKALSRLGRLEDARDHFLAIDRLGRDVRSAELRARAWLGLASIGQMRGNYAMLEAMSRRALRLAKREGLSFSERYARLGLMIAAGARHDFDAALHHGWAVYLASAGQPIEEGEILQSFGQLMVEARCYAEARAAFGAVVSRALPARIIVPALGGLATSAAETNRPAIVRWAASQLQLLASLGAPRYTLSLAYLECSAALSRIGLALTADELRTRAVSLAEAHGFHEVTIRAAEAGRRDDATATAAFTLRGRAVRIAGRIASLEPTELPDEVSVLAIPA